jgi:glycosyltransferase involved in cell wall biosynthesis
VAPGDPAELAAAIDVATMNPAEAGRRGAAARQAYLTHYTPRASLQALEAVYADALAERHNASGQAAVSSLATEAFHVA